jgi:hypothetical protein
MNTPSEPNLKNLALKQITNSLPLFFDIFNIEKGLLIFFDILSRVVYDSKIQMSSKCYCDPCQKTVVKFDLILIMKPWILGVDSDKLDDMDLSQLSVSQNSLSQFCQSKTKYQFVFQCPKKQTNKQGYCGLYYIQLCTLILDCDNVVMKSAFDYMTKYDKMS